MMIAKPGRTGPPRLVAVESKKEDPAVLSERLRGALEDSELGSFDVHLDYVGPRETFGDERIETPNYRELAVALREPPLTEPGRGVEVRLTVVVRECRLEYDDTRVHAVQLKVAPQKLDIPGQGLDCNHLPPSSDHSSRKERVEADVGSHVPEHHSRPELGGQSALLRGLVAPQPATVRCRAHDPTEPPARSTEDREDGPPRKRTQGESECATQGRECGDRQCASHPLLTGIGGRFRGPR